MLKYRATVIDLSCCLHIKVKKGLEHVLYIKAVPVRYLFFIFLNNHLILPHQNLGKGVAGIPFKAIKHTNL